MLTNLFGTEERHREVNAAMANTIAQMEFLGATIVRLALPEYDALSSQITTAEYEARTVMDRYFATLPPDAPVKNFAQLVAARTSAVQKTLEQEISVVDGMNSAAYKDRMLNRDKLRLAVAKLMADNGLDAVIYPQQRILVVPVTAEEQFERNGTLSNSTGFPAVTFQAGYSTPTGTAPLGVPVGAELLGPDYSEARLLAFAYAFEQTAQVRKPPTSTPPLSNEP